MVRFNIIGYGFLDVSDPSGVSFKAQNQHFRFAEISLGRSTEFSVPATDHNRTMLDFGEDPAETGDMLRKVWPAQMVYDCDVVNGTIAVTGYSSEAFTCVFTIGNADWIDAVQNRKLSECVSSWDKGVPWSQTGTPVDANDPALAAMDEAIIRYENSVHVAGWQLVPSVRVKSYIEDILTNLSITHYIDIDTDLWMVAGSMKGGLTDNVTLVQTSYDNFSVTQSQGYIDVADVTVEWATANVFGALVGGGNFQGKAFLATQDVTMTFPSSLPPALYVIRWNKKLSRCEVLGASSDNAFPRLIGSTVSVKKGQSFFFASKPLLEAPNNYGWETGDIVAGSVSVIVERDEDLTLGETWFIRNNQPDMTVFEFLKSVALATGTELTVDGMTGVTMGAGRYGASSDFKALDRVVAVEQVTRRVESWGNDTKTAAIVFNSDDYVTDRIRSAYDVDNEQQQGISDHVSKFSEGNVGDDGIVIEDVDASSNPPKFKAKRWTLAMATADSEWLQRIDTPDPVGYADLATNSTCTQLRCAMQLAEFFALQPSTVLLWRGCAYLWTDASWSDGVLSLTLQRVSAQQVPSRLRRPSRSTPSRRSSRKAPRWW